MKGSQLLDFLPLWGVFACTSLLVLVAIEIGYRVGRYRHKLSTKEKEVPVGAMAGATLGLLAFLLAFTFGVAATRFDARRQVLLDEANAIGTAYLRADLLPEHREDIRKLLCEYVDIRLEAVNIYKVSQAIQRSEAIHAQLWAHAAAVGTNKPDSVAAGLFIQSVNQLIDLHATRVYIALRSRVPGVNWLTLYIVAMLALSTMGYHSGLSGTTRSLAVLAVAIAFSTVIWLIVDLDRPYEGAVRVSQQPMIDLRNSMHESNQ